MKINIILPLKDFPNTRLIKENMIIVCPRYIISFYESKTIDLKF